MPGFYPHPNGPQPPDTRKNQLNHPAFAQPSCGGLLHGFIAFRPPRGPD